MESADRDYVAEEEYHPDSETHGSKRLLGSDFISAQPDNIQDSLRDLKNVQKKYSTLMIEYQKEDLELKKKYLALATPLFKMRYDIVNKSGRSDPPPVDNWSSGHSRGIPGFWLNAMKNHPKIAKHVTPDDEELLYHLCDIRVEDLEGDKNGFSLVFEFSSNDYFKDRRLKKTYTYERPCDQHEPSNEIEDDVYDHELTYGDMKGKSISWKEGMNQTVTTKADGQKQPKTSFFTFFRVPTREMVRSFISPDGEDSSFDNEEVENMYDWLVGQHYELGEAFKDDLIPHAVHWYTGQATLYVTVDDEDEDDDEDDEEYGYWEWDVTFKRYFHTEADGSIIWAEQNN